MFKITRNAPGNYDIVADKTGTQFKIMGTVEGKWEISTYDYDIGGVYTENTLKEAKRMIGLIITEGGL